MAMSLRERLFPTRKPAPEQPTLPPRPAEPSIHINADGETVIDLRQPPIPMPAVTTTDMPCHQCGAIMAVDEIDDVAHMALLSCRECGFRYHHNLKH